MGWIKVADGHYERPLGENEQFIKKIGDGAAAISREHWSVTASACFSIVGLSSNSDLNMALLAAWKTLRFSHPSIAAVPSPTTLAYKVPDKTSLEQWAASTFCIAEDATTEDVIAGFEPSPHLTMTFVPASMEIVLHTSHWRTDGIGLPQLIGAFFGILAAQKGKPEAADLEWGTEVARLAPAVEDALSLPLEPTIEINATVNWCMSTLANLQDAVGIECHKQATGPPGGTRSSKLQLSEAATSQIISACEERSLSLLGAVHASAAAATYMGAAAENKKKHYTSTMRFSMRPYMPAPFNGPEYASALYTSGYLIKVSGSNSWLENARTYSNAYAEGVSANFVQARRAYALRVLERMGKQALPSPPPSEIDISSMDDAERLVATEYTGDDGFKVEVQSVSLGVETLTRQTYCFVWWFRGRLNLSLVYNEAFYDAEEVSGHVSNIRRSLCEELGVTGW